MQNSDWNCFYLHKSSEDNSYPTITAILAKSSRLCLLFEFTVSGLALTKHSARTGLVCVQLLSFERATSGVLGAISISSCLCALTSNSAGTTRTLHAARQDYSSCKRWNNDATLRRWAEPVEPAGWESEPPAILQVEGASLIKVCGGISFLLAKRKLFFVFFVVARTTLDSALSGSHLREGGGRVRKRRRGCWAEDAAVTETRTAAKIKTSRSAWRWRAAAWFPPFRAFSRAGLHLAESWQVNGSRVSDTQSAVTRASGGAPAQFRPVNISCYR